MTQGIIGKKLGMTQAFRENGRMEAVTAIEAGPCTVTQVKVAEKDGYNAAQLGYGKAKKLTAAEKGHLKGLGEFKYLREFRQDDAVKAKVGDKVNVSLFKAGERVNIIGVSKGRGFAGVVKRHHFKGGPKTHGESDRTRHPGAIGSTTTPGRIWKGLRMAGHMGNARVTVQNLEIVQADAAKNLLLVKGAVPGAINGLLLIEKTGRK